MKKQPTKKRKYRIFDILTLFFTAVFLVSSGLWARDYLLCRRQQDDFDQLASLFSGTSVPALPPPGRTSRNSASSLPDTPPVPQVTEDHNSSDSLKNTISPQEWMLWWESRFPARAPIYQALYRKNPHMAGWIRIEGTSIDYPVCHTPDQPEYYLHRDFNGHESSYGTPFLDACCSPGTPRASLLIYAHHMKNGSMFAPLQNYTDISYYRQHPYIQFDTPDTASSYEIAAAATVDASGRLLWQQLLFPEDEESFSLAWQNFQNRQFYDTGVPLSCQDELLALVTCEYTQKDSRLMIVARKIPRP